MEILHKSSEQKGVFYIQPEQDILAEMTYFHSGEKEITIDHTEVKEALKGQGAGKLLVEAAVFMAREKGWSVVPVCPFAKSALQRNAEWHDVLSQ